VICVATDISLPSETIRTMPAHSGRASSAPQGADFHKKPTVFRCWASKGFEYRHDSVSILGRHRNSSRVSYRPFFYVYMLASSS